MGQLYVDRALTLTGPKFSTVMCAALVPRRPQRKNWRALALHFGRSEHMSDIVQAVAGLLSHQQTAHPRPRPASVNTGNATHLDMPPPTVHEVVKGCPGNSAVL